MASHESFWVATSAAAPVIALAAIVALPDTSIPARRAYGDWVAARRDYRDNPEDRIARLDALSASQLRWQTALIRWATLVNLLAQASVLAVSLWALAYHQDLMPPPVALALAAGGIILLAWSTTAVVNLRQYPSLNDKPADDSR